MTTTNPAPMKLVVIDDDPKNLKFVSFILTNAGLDIHTASDPQAGLDLIHRLRPQIVLMDLVMPGVQGMELLQKIVEFDPGIDVILMTGYYSTESAVEAIQKGAADYFPKPFSPEKLRQRIALIVDDAKRRQRSYTLDNELLANFQFEGIIGRSPLMLDLFSKIRRVAPHFRSVLITGATGSGKELVAKALHHLSGSDTSKAPSLELTRIRSASSSTLTAVRPCSTKSAKCQCPCSPNCCASCKTTRSSASARRRSLKWTCASWPPLTATSMNWLAKETSAKISTSVFPPLNSKFLRLPSVRRIYRCSKGTS